MSKDIKKQSYKLQPYEKLPKEVQERLQTINDKYSKSRDFSNYLADLRELFGVSTVQPTEDHKKYLGGYMEGEASVNVSLKKLATARFGVLLDPEFSITQHVNGFKTLYLALSIFQTGRIRYKHGSNATLVFVIDNRQSIEEKVLPFYKSYVQAFTSEDKAERLDNFSKILGHFNENSHKDLAAFRDKMLPIWDAMRKQAGQTNQSFPDLQAAQQFVTDFARNKEIIK